MKKRRWGSAGVLAGLIFLLAGCSGGGKAPAIVLDGSYELTLGKSNMKEVQEAGFTERYALSNNPETIPAQSWENFYAMKDEISYGTMLAGNKSSKDIPFEEGVVFEISFDYDSEDYELGQVTVDGVDYRGYTRDQVKEAMGDVEPSHDSEEFLTYESKKSSYSFHFADGSETVSSLKINDGTEKEYVIE